MIESKKNNISDVELKNMTNNNKKEDLIGNYSIKSFSQNRQLLSDIYDEFLKKHYMTGFIDVNITKGRKVLKKYYQKSGEKISFASWIVKCIADSVKENPVINSFRKGRNKIIQFDDIDIVIMIEKRIEDKVIPIPYSLRKCNEKSILEISREIRKVQSEKSSEKDQLTEQGKILKVYRFIPKSFRQIAIRRMIKNPFYIKKQGGLIVLTSVSVFTNSSGWVAGFGGMLTVSIALGGKSFKQINLDGKLQEQEYLQVTVSIDHDIIDGGPATRFIANLVDKIEQGYLLESLP